VEPVERVTIYRGDATIMLEERLHPDRSELRGRPAHVAARGRPAPLQCCSIGERKGWSIEFPQRSLRVAEDPG